MRLSCYDIFFRKKKQVEVSDFQSSLSLRTAAASTKSAGRRAILTNLDASCSDSVTFRYISQFLEARTLKVTLPSEVSPSFLEPKGIARALNNAICTCRQKTIENPASQSAQPEHQNSLPSSSHLGGLWATQECVELHFGCQSPGRSNVLHKRKARGGVAVTTVLTNQPTSTAASALRNAQSMILQTDRTSSIEVAWLEAQPWLCRAWHWAADFFCATFLKSARLCGAWNCELSEPCMSACKGGCFSRKHAIRNKLMASEDSKI